MLGNNYVRTCNFTVVSFSLTTMQSVGRSVGREKGVGVGEEKACKRLVMVSAVVAVGRSRQNERGTPWQSKSRLASKAEVGRPPARPAPRPQRSYCHTAH